MNITISLTPEVEQRLRAKAAASNKTIEEYVQWIAEQFAAGPPPPPKRSPEEWIKDWREWVASHQPTGGTLDDDRESIYAGRGE